MRPTPFSKAALALCWLRGAATTLCAQSTQAPPRPALAARPPREFLCSPRETVRTLYYAAVAYDFQPALIDEAINCLDLCPARLANPAESARLAIDMEQVLYEQLMKKPATREEKTALVGGYIALSDSARNVLSTSNALIDRAINGVDLPDYSGVRLKPPTEGASGPL